MKPFVVGEQVTIRYGVRQGQEAHVVEKQPAEVYKVRLDDGSCLFFGRASLSPAPVNRLTRQPEPPAWGSPSRN